MYFKQSVIKFLIVTTAFSVALIACQPQQAPSTQNTQAASASSTTAPASNSSSSMSSMANMSFVTDPVMATDDQSKQVNADIYEGLVTMKDNQAAPALATSWTVSEDGLDYVFSLRTGVKFTDGTTFNADAVIANFNRWFDPQNAAHGSGTYDAWTSVFGGFKGQNDASGKPQSKFDGIQKVDENTVLIHLNTPVNDLLIAFAGPEFAIVSPASFKGGAFGTSTAPGAGTGPYKIGTWTGQQIQLVPNTDYWGAVPTDSPTFSMK